MLRMTANGHQNALNHIKPSCVSDLPRPTSAVVGFAGSQNLTAFVRVESCKESCVKVNVS